ncbi:MAG: universal stress protein [Pseudomonadales bacterium]|nr:universal stress protein [Pseudomonadales bacterium]
MDEIKTVLAVVCNRDDGEIVLEKAVHIARVNEAVLHVIRVVYEGFVDLSVHAVEKSRELKQFVMQAEEAFLEDLIDPWRNQLARLDSATVWHKSEWEAILDSARELKADLIVKPTEYPVQEVIRTPQDWNLLRHAEIPVMLVKPIAWPDHPRIAAAIDATNKEEQAMNVRILREAEQICHSLNGKLHVVSAFPSIEHWMGPITIAIDFEQAREAVSNQIKHEVSLLARECGVHIDEQHALEGEPGTVIKRKLDELDAEILVMGTRARHGVMGMVLGNTSESIIHKINSDVIVLR